MIIGIGTDLIEVARVEKLLAEFGDKFITRNYTKGEQAISHDKPSFYAKRFAAKEAVAKALGTGIAGGIHFTDIEILNDDKGTPKVSLYNKAYDLYESLIPEDKTSKIAISLSDEKNYAIAMVVISAE